MNNFYSMEHSQHRRPNNLTKRFLDIINLFQLKQLIKEHTRVTESTESLIDVILTNNHKRITESRVMHIGISDHSLIQARRKIALTKSRLKTIETRNFKSYNLAQFKTDLEETLTINDWESQNPQVNWMNFKTIINQIAKLHVPTRVRRVRSQCPLWLTKLKKKE